MDLDKFIVRIFKQTNKLHNELLNSGHYISRRLKKNAQINATFDPKIRTGELWKSIGTVVSRTDNKVEIVLKAGNDTAYYTKFIEFGTKDGRLYPRLFLMRARNSALEKLPEDLKQRTKILLEKI